MARTVAVGAPGRLSMLELGRSIACVGLFLVAVSGCRTMERLTSREPVPDTWSRQESAHFVIITDGSTYDARVILRRLEQYYEVMSRVGFTTRPFERDRLEIIATRDGRVMPLHPVPPSPLVFRGYSWLNQVPLGMERPAARAAWDGVRGAPVLLVSAALGGDAERCIRREVVRRFVSHQMPEAPAWLREGLAELWGEVRIGEDIAVVGHAFGLAFLGPYGEITFTPTSYAAWYLQPTFDPPTRSLFDMGLAIDLVEPRWLDCETGHFNWGFRPELADRGADPGTVEVLMGAPNRVHLMQYIRALTRGEPEREARARLDQAVGEEVFDPNAWAPLGLHRFPIPAEVLSAPVALREGELSDAEASVLEARMLLALAPASRQPEAVGLLQRAQRENPADDDAAIFLAATSGAPVKARQTCPDAEGPVDGPAWAVFRARAPLLDLVACAQQLADQQRRADARTILKVAVAAAPDSPVVHHAIAQLALGDGRVACAAREERRALSLAPRTSVRRIEATRALPEPPALQGGAGLDAEPAPDDCP